MDVLPGVAYGIVVTGYDGQFGTYEIAITADQVSGAAQPCTSCLQLAFSRALVQWFRRTLCRQTIWQLPVKHMCGCMAVMGKVLVRTSALIP